MSVLLETVLLPSELPLKIALHQNQLCGTPRLPTKYLKGTVSVPPVGKEGWTGHLLVLREWSLCCICLACRDESERGSVAAPREECKGGERCVQRSPALPSHPNDTNSIDLLNAVAKEMGELRGSWLMLRELQSRCGKIEGF